MSEFTIHFDIKLHADGSATSTISILNNPSAIHVINVLRDYANTLEARAKQLKKTPFDITTNDLIPKTENN